MLLGVAANAVWNLLVGWGPGFTALVVVALVFLMCARARKARRLRRVSQRVLDAANHAVHRLMNAEPPMAENVLQREYELWEHEQLLWLRRCHAKKLCSERQVDHFET